MLMPIFGVEIERDILGFLVQLRMGCSGQPLGQGGLTVKPVRKLSRRKHRFGVSAGRLAKAGIEREEGRAGLRSGLIRQVQKHLFGLGIIVAKRDIGRRCRGRFQSRVLC